MDGKTKIIVVGHIGAGIRAAMELQTSMAQFEDALRQVANKEHQNELESRLEELKITRTFLPDPEIYLSDYNAHPNPETRKHKSKRRK